jgi:1,4-alpha-glucan branching enzyme
VRQFLIDNGKSLLQEYHVDGLRYDQVTVIAESGGWYFAQDLTNTLRYVKPEAVQIAEYWDNDPGNRWKGIAVPPYGMGFDMGYSDALRDTLRDLIAQTTGGRTARVNFDKLRDALYMTYKEYGRAVTGEMLDSARCFPAALSKARFASGTRPTTYTTTWDTTSQDCQVPAKSRYGG